MRRRKFTYAGAVVNSELLFSTLVPKILGVGGAGRTTVDRSARPELAFGPAVGYDSAVANQVTITGRVVSCICRYNAGGKLCANVTIVNKTMIRGETKDNYVRVVGFDGIASRLERHHEEGSLEGALILVIGHLNDHRWINDKNYPMREINILIFDLEIIHLGRRPNKAKMKPEKDPF